MTDCHVLIGLFKYWLKSWNLRGSLIKTVLQLKWSKYWLKSWNLRGSLIKTVSVISFKGAVGCQIFIKGTVGKV